MEKSCTIKELRAQLDEEYRKLSKTDVPFEIAEHRRKARSIADRIANMIVNEKTKEQVRETN